LIKELLDAAIAIEGLPSHTSTHAAGVLITPEPVASYVPVWYNKDTLVCQFDMEMLEKLGLLKMDFLGLKTLTVEQMTTMFVEENYGVKITQEQMLEVVDDPTSYEMARRSTSDEI